MNRSNMRPAMVSAAMIVLLALTACAPANAPPTRLEQPETALPPMKMFASVPARPPARANDDIVRDFIDLSFKLESGRDIGAFSRFEGPVGIALAGAVPPTAAAELDRLIARLQGEAGLSVHRASPDEAAISITFLPRKVMQSRVPRAACFVAPRISTWEEYRRARRSTLDWTTVVRRERAAIFIPNDTAPQEIRDCLHEELAQALGPLNDLYRLPDSVFNDDNIHTVLTGFDMLVLRLTYAPDLHSGMSKTQVAALLPALVDRINPAGRSVPPRYPGDTPQAFNEAIETALGAGARTGVARRLASAERAVSIARAEGWQDARAGFAYLALGRLSIARDPVAALTAFEEAGRIYGSDPLLASHVAHASIQIAAMALATGQPDLALTLATDSLPQAAATQNAALLASFLMVRSAALDALGRTAEAREVRLDSLGWARYGFGSDAEIRERVLSITRLASTKRLRTQ